MARIPDTLGGNPTPRPSRAVVQGPRPRNDGAIAIANSLGRAGDVLYQAMEEERQRINRAKVEDSFNELRNGQIDLTVGEQTGFQNIRGGDAIKLPLLKTYTEKFNAMTEALASKLDNDEQRDAFKKRAGLAQAQMTQDILQHLYRENNVYQGQVFKGIIDTEQRAGMAKWDKPAEVQASMARQRAAIDAEGMRLGLPPEAVADMKLQAGSAIHSGVIGQALAAKQYEYAQKWFEANRDEVDAGTAKVLMREVEQATQKQRFDGYQTAFLANQDSSAGLKKLHEAAIKDKDLDEDRKNVIVGRLQNRMEVLENRAIRQREEAIRAVERDVNSAMGLVLQGYEPSAAQLSGLLSRARGTGLEGQVQQMIVAANATTTFKNMGPREQEAAITQVEVNTRQNPTPASVTMLSRMKSIRESQQREVASDPTTFAVRQGMVDPKDPAAQPLNFSDPSQLQTQLGARLNLSRSMSGKYGVPVKPLTAAEESQVAVTLRKASPQAKRDLFAMLSQATGNDFDGYKAVMAQLAPDDPVTAIAGTFAGKSARDPAAKAQGQAADLMLRGQAILNPVRKEDGSPDKGKLWPMPAGADEQAMRSEFFSSVGDAFAGMPKAQTDLYQAATSIYATLVSDKGDNSGNLNRDLWEKSIQMATGGVGKYNGRATVLPWGMDLGDFKNQTRNRINALVASGVAVEGVTASKLADMPLLAIGDGKYALRAGDGVMVGKDNRPLVIDFNVPLQPALVAKPVKSRGPATMRTDYK